MRLQSALATISCAFWLMLWSSFIAAKSIDLEVRAWVEPSEEIIVSQQVILNVEVSTSSYFVGGTRLLQPEVSDAIVLRRESFAVNSTKRISGETWAVQLWTMTVYPQREGRFEIPPIDIETTVSGEDGQPTKLSARSAEVSFEANVPSGAPQDAQWVATTEFSVEEHFDRDFDSLALGDAISRTITFRGDDLAAMMLPELRFDRTHDGLSIYPTPPELSDKVNRGDYLAQRIEKITYVVEKPGRFTIPERRFHWFDLGSRTFKVEVLPEQTITTVLSPRYYLRSAIESTVDFMSERSVFDWILLVVFIFACYRLRTRFKALLRAYHRDKANRKARRDLESRFVAECRSSNFIEAARLLYRWLDLRAQADDHARPSKGSSDNRIEWSNGNGVMREFIDSFRGESDEQSVSAVLEAFESLMAEAFDKAQRASPASDRGVFKRMIRELATLESRKKRSLLRLKQINLTLN
ncbi:hypothetical protein A3742_12305 [Oleiphilus sp. HI0071]|uniref:BatD family protein n=1 Tax=unclassified Oleiphilus TaxID=2631174 RepID=UPI0007C3B916|nr:MULTISPECIES: BatD family protein [unclassified Oleiphilus]KZY73725.1 hypothetical protein A3737_26330 [Oleiphilus sp. HI0065]KZY80840.1 hypothetical protein A3742_12305 [Oleiphilus sp. HI0071]KZY91232.1 hypothetical protein A3744_05090 [Oleiphilus sp. HI0073]KZZ42255.1 hypothetical protein A3758_06735 [Oleiphilus sp. HI0118]KZZ60298.1 hypothetical protein A3760_05335 [Oleiphilus sp. HI0122]KZZ71077.1 hypothetical protein A3765_15345 [Oleiphilus sp. HI0130]KZZ82060.1 hypothetical protein 